MATQTQQDDELDLEDEKKRRAGSIGRAIGPKPLPSAAGSIGKPLPPPVSPAPSDAPAIQSTPAPTPSLGPSTLGQGPAYPRPAAEAASAMAAKGAPTNYGGGITGGLKKAADTIAGSTGIGRDIEAASGLGTYGYEANLDRANKAAATEETGIDNQQKEKEQAAKTNTEEIGSQLQNVGGIDVMTSKVASPASTILANTGKVDVANITQGGANSREASKESQNQPLIDAKTSLANAQTEYEKFKSDPKSPMYQIARQRLQIALDDYEIKQKEFGYNYEPSTLTPEERGTLPTDPSGQPVSLHSPLKPSSQVVTAATRATQVTQQLPRIRKEVQDLANEIGPGAGRWNALVSGKGGFSDPQYTRIHADQEFLSSALGLMHASGRMPAPILAKFDQLYADSSQSADNFLAALDIADQWIPKIAEAGQTVGERANGQGGGGQAGAQTSPPTPGGIPKFSEWKQSQVKP